jgi:hypothetical protein
MEGAQQDSEISGELVEAGGERRHRADFGDDPPIADCERVAQLVATGTTDSMAIANNLELDPGYVLTIRGSNAFRRIIASLVDTEMLKARTQAIFLAGKAMDAMAERLSDDGALKSAELTFVAKMATHKTDTFVHTGDEETHRHDPEVDRFLKEIGKV